MHSSYLPYTLFWALAGASERHGVGGFYCAVLLLLLLLLLPYTRGIERAANPNARKTQVFLNFCVRKISLFPSCGDETIAVVVSRGDDGMMVVASRRRGGRGGDGRRFAATRWSQLHFKRLTSIFFAM